MQQFYTEDRRIIHTGNLKWVKLFKIACIKNISLENERTSLEISFEERKVQSLQAWV